MGSSVLPGRVSPPPAPSSGQAPEPFDPAADLGNPKERSIWPLWDGGLTLRLAMFRQSVTEGVDLQWQHPGGASQQLHIFSCPIVEDGDMCTYSTRAERVDYDLVVVERHLQHNHQLFGLSPIAKCKKGETIERMEHELARLTQQERDKWTRYLNATTEPATGTTRSGRKRIAEESVANANQTASPSRRSSSRSRSQSRSRRVRQYSPSPELGVGRWPIKSESSGEEVRPRGPFTPEAKLQQGRFVWIAQNKEDEESDRELCLDPFSLKNMTQSSQAESSSSPTPISRNELAAKSAQYQKKLDKLQAEKNFLALQLKVKTCERECQKLRAQLDLVKQSR